MFKNINLPKFIIEFHNMYYINDLLFREIEFIVMSDFLSSISI